MSEENCISINNTAVDTSQHIKAVWLHSARMSGSLISVIHDNKLTSDFVYTWKIDQHKQKKKFPLFPMEFFLAVK